MSQASNKLRWCLNKAKRELEEAGRHRGLVEKKQDIKLALKHIVKAEHNLKAAHFFKNNGYSDWSASAFFYCTYHCFLAILTKFGYESRNQECTIAAIETLKEEGKINIDEKYINTLKINNEEDHSTIKTREDYQYGTEIEFTKKEEFDWQNKICREILEISKEMMSS